MAEGDLYPRFAESVLLEALDDAPVVLIQGARQCGKTTLAQAVGRQPSCTFATRGSPVASSDSTRVR